MTQIANAGARFDADPRDGPIWTHFIAGARLVYVKYTAAIAVSNCAQMSSVAYARNLEISSTFEPGAPKYVQVSRAAAVLHLSEHYGDCSPGAKVLIHIDDVEALHRELSSRPNPNMRPGVELAPWNAKVMEVSDPFGNRLCFNQSLTTASPS